MVGLAQRKLRISKPHLRRKGKHPGKSTEIEIPAYAAMRIPSRLGGRMLEMLHPSAAAPIRHKRLSRRRRAGSIP